MGSIRRVMCGIKRVNPVFVLTVAADNSVRMRTLGQPRPHGTQ